MKIIKSNEQLQEFLNGDKIVLEFQEVVFTYPVNIHKTIQSEGSLYFLNGIKTTADLIVGSGIWSAENIEVGGLIICDLELKCGSRLIVHDSVLVGQSIYSNGGILVGRTISSGGKIFSNGVVDADHIITELGISADGVIQAQTIHPGLDAEISSNTAIRIGGEIFTN